MTLTPVDVAARGDDPIVAAVVHPDAPIVVSWETGGGSVACASLRHDGDELTLVRLATAAGVSRAVAGLTLVRAILGAASARRVVALAGNADREWLLSSGFVVEGVDGDTTRMLFEVEARLAAPSEVAAVTLYELETLIRESWTSETSGAPQLWSAENPARGQCDVTALLVRELLGGDILVANVVRDGRRTEGGVRSSV